ncbi:MAG: protein kinase [Lachnospiraceae bacterium]|nr:protein kinase [Lachnospiraceae bacterium]
MDYNSRLEISYYSVIATINEAHRIYLVQHIETKKIFVKKVLSVYNLSVYQQIKDKPIAGLPRIYCLYEEDNELTIIEEYISGNTIQDLLNTFGRISEPETKRIMVELCDILTTLHKSVPTIIHRDIKPSNVIIMPSGQVRLIDLNAARPNNEKDEDTILLGTKGYAAPEQYGFGSSNVQTDIYAAGMLINTMLCGSFSREICNSPYFKNIIKKCTELNPKDRYTSFAQLKSELTHGAKRNAVDSTSRRRFIPPGFRTGNILHMLLALPTYIFLFWLCLDMEVKDYTGFVLWFERIGALIFFLLLVACGTNYLNIQKLMPLCSHKNLFVRIIGGLILTFILVIIWVSFMILGESLLT